MSAGFVGTTDAGERVRVNAFTGEVQVMLNGQPIAQGWPVVADGLWSWPGLTVAPEGPAESLELDWHEVGGVRAEGGTFAGDRAEARLGDHHMLFPSASRVRAGVRRVAGLSSTGEAVEWLIGVSGKDCGCNG